VGDFEGRISVRPESTMKHHLFCVKILTVSPEAGDGTMAAGKRTVTVERLRLDVSRVIPGDRGKVGLG
jgi:hypothetical protein